MDASSTVPKLTQKQRLLELLKARGAISNYELRSMQPPMFQYPARIWELIQDGEPIIGYKDAHDKRKWWYKYVVPAKDLFDFDKPIC